MRIAFLLTQSLESPSGLGRFGPIARELAVLGEQVEVIALHPDLSSLSRRVYRDRGVQVAYVGQMHVRKRGSRKTYFSTRQLLAVTLASTLKLTLAVIRSKADAVQLCKPHPNNVIASRLGARGRPIYCDCDDFEAESNRFSARWQRPLVRHFEDGVGRYAAGLTVNTKFTQDRYAELDFSPARMVYVPNGVERARFNDVRSSLNARALLGLGATEPIIVYVGTMSTVSHAVGLLLKSFKRVNAELPAARLLLVGGGEDYDLLQSQAQRLGLADRIVFTGRVDPSDIADYYTLGTVSVDPVEDDLIARARSPLKIVESLACGIPVVTGDIGDRRLMLNDGETGVLVPPGDAISLADGLLSVLQDPARRTRMARMAASRRDELCWDRLIHTFASVYAGLPVAKVPS